MPACTHMHARNSWSVLFQRVVVCRAAGTDGAQPHRDFRAIEHSAEVVWEFPKTLAAEPLLLEIVKKTGGCLDKLMCVFVCLREREREGMFVKPFWLAWKPTLPVMVSVRPASQVESFVGIFLDTMSVISTRLCFVTVLCEL